MSTRDRFTVNDHVALRRVTSIAASPHHRWLAVAVQRLDADGARYASDLWRVPLDGGAATQLTRGASRDTAPRFRRDGALAFLSNRRAEDATGGEEAEGTTQVWLLPSEGGEPRQLTREPLGVEAYVFAARADRLALLAKTIPNVPRAEQREAERSRAKKGPSARRYTRQMIRHWDHWLDQSPDRPSTHVFVCDEEGRGSIDVTPAILDELAIEPEIALSDDGRLLAFTQRTLGGDRIHDAGIWLYDCERRAPRALFEAPSSGMSGIRFSPDGASIAAALETRSVEQVSVRLVSVDVATGAVRDLAPGWDRWPKIWGYDPSGDALLVTADDGGDVPVFEVGVRSGEVRRLTGQGSFGEVTVIEGEGSIACVRSTFLDAPECVTVRGGDITSLARLSGFAGAEAWAEVERVTVPSTDGARVQTFLVKPKGVSEPLPFVLWIHGGPIGAFADGWHWRWNPLLLVAAGYAVALPNPRGSTGFGQAFIDGIWGNQWGGQCYHDLMAVTDAMAARPDIDPRRTAAMGGSFGGYMVNWIGTQTSRFRCLVTHACVASLSTCTATMDMSGWGYLEAGGESPYHHLERFDRFSPMRGVAGWRTPTLVIHGEQDYRCPIGEGIMLFEALQHLGVPSELLVFPDEGHWITKPNNIIAWYDAIMEVAGRYTRREEALAEGAALV